MQQRHQCADTCNNVILRSTRVVIRCKWLLFIISSTIFSLHILRGSTQVRNTSWDTEDIGEECVCFYKNHTYDFCYHLPYDKSIKGLRFNCSYASNLEELGLLSPIDVIDLSSQKIPQPAFIAAISQNHYHEGITMLANFRAMFPNQKIFVYDLGLQPELRKEIESKCLVEVRTFPFDRYQSNMKRLTEYRWKAILVAVGFTAVREFGAVWYMDTSIRWMKDIRPLVYDAYESRKRNGERFPSSAMMHLALRRSTFITTHPGTYAFLPTNMKEIKKKTCQHMQSGFMFFIRTKDAVEILKWFVLCSLEENCIAPSGAKRSCEFAHDRYEKYANCHRFDQSVINLLLANVYRCNISNYFSSIGRGVKAIHNEDRSLRKIDFACSYKKAIT